MNLLSTLDASLVVYLLSVKKDWKLAFDPATRMTILETDIATILLREEFIKNAIKAGKLPAEEVPKGKVADKKLFNKLKVPKEFHDDIKQFDYWITLEDLFTFLEQKPTARPKAYAHGRDALARLLCALIDQNHLNEKDIIQYLEHQIESVEKTMNTDLMLKENTLKGCCREILDAYSTLKTKLRKQG